jgi:hypothetical protein
VGQSPRSPRLEVCDVHITKIPTIPAIQRSTGIVAVLVAAFMWMAFSSADAMACLLGAALMMVNLYALSLTVRGLFAIARQAGGATTVGLVALPLKMLLLAGVVYELIESCRVNMPCFITGTLIQFAGIFIEVGRAAVDHNQQQPC